MVSTRLDRLVTGPIARSYLTAIDGFWADAVLSEFAFLEARGYELGPIVLHYNGDAISYRGPRGFVRHEFVPDGGWISADASLFAATQQFEGDLDLLAQHLHPGIVLPERTPLTEPVVVELVRFWAGVVREFEASL